MNRNTVITRSNQNAIMFLNRSSGRYTVVDLRDHTTSTNLSLNAAKKRWNRNYGNSRQYHSGDGVNHRFLSAI
jgi:hypothetical protein